MNFVTIDFETGYRSPDSAVSVGLVHFVNDEPCDSLSALICPPLHFILSEFTEIHGISMCDVENAPDFADVWREKILPFINAASQKSGKKLPLVAHNAVFDRRVLYKSLEARGIEFETFDWIDTLAISRRAWPNLPSHALTKLAAHFGFVYNAHDALADAKMCGQILVLANKQIGE